MYVLEHVARRDLNGVAAKRCQWVALSSPERNIKIDKAKANITSVWDISLSLSLTLVIPSKYFPLSLTLVIPTNGTLIVFDNRYVNEKMEKTKHIGDSYF